MSFLIQYGMTAHLRNPDIDISIVEIIVRHKNIHARIKIFLGAMFPSMQYVPTAKMITHIEKPNNNFAEDLKNDEIILSIIFYPPSYTKPSSEHSHNFWIQLSVHCFLIQELIYALLPA